jgi:exodeoxyribonuclease V alpha subunit
MDLIPLDARTLHKRLGISASTPSGNRHSQGHLSTADLVVVDEASMVPLPLMALLVAQLAPHASLVLLGDRDQLTSVDLGSVLGDLVEAASGLPYSRNFATGAAALGVAVPDVAPQADGPLTDAVHRLIHTHRFKTTDTIGRFCLALQENKPHEAVNALIVSGCLAPPPGPLSGARPSVSIAEIVSAAVSGHYASLASIRDPAEALTTLNSFRLLTSHRIGAYGVEAINRLACLAVGHHPGELFHGLPILVTRNAPELDLWNGDCGVLLRNPASGVLEAWFHGLPGCPPRSFGPAILPEWEPAYAMSIHKSQGSEFAAVTIVLPPEDSPILTRELLYTGASRARERLTVHADEQLLALALSRTVARPSGLVERLRSCSLQIHQ